MKQLPQPTSSRTAAPTPMRAETVALTERRKHSLFSAASKAPVDVESLSKRSSRRFLYVSLLLLPLSLFTIIVLCLSAGQDSSLPSRIVRDEMLETDSEHPQPEILSEIQTRFVAPSALRLPRAKRHMHYLVPLMLPEMFIGNVSDEELEWSTDGDSGDESVSDSDEADAAGLFYSQEINWEVGGGGSTITTKLPLTAEETETSAEVELEWPGDRDDSLHATREAQARRMIEYMDSSADPCTDFYQYACGRWALRHPIPRDKAGFDTFELLRERLDKQLRILLEQESREDESVAVRKARDLYHSCMNHDLLTSRGSDPLLKLINALGGWPAIDADWNPATFDWIRLMAALRRMNNDILIAQWIGPDIKQSEQYMMQLDQTSLGLPNRDYFLQTSNAAYLAAYRTFMMRTLTLLGASQNNATKSADEIVAFEIEIARMTATAEERRNVSALYRRWTLLELEQYMPGIEWRRYLTLVLGYALADTEPIVVFAERYFQRLAVLVNTTPPKTVANYLLWRFVRHRVSNLDERFQDIRQRFYCALFGREQAPPRWKDCVSQVNANMGMAVGALFVNKHFDENSKNDTLHMTQDMQEAFRSLLNTAVWLDEETRTLSSEKVTAMMLRIGYPDFILSKDQLDERYSTLNISREAYFENMIALLRYSSKEERAKLGTAVNKTQWNTAPSVVNAYYSRNKNQIMFPAGILQPPFYHRHFPKSINFGGIGVVIGHEITHGFDDKGRLFDRAGNMQRWWPESAIQNFHERAQCLVEQYGRYTVDEVAMQVDGLNTQGENIADNGGIKQAFMAYEAWLENHDHQDEMLPGLNATHLQLFFINFAQVWCGAMRPEATRNKLKTAVHSPGKFRVIGTLSNFPEFAKVFQCPLGSPMNPEVKCAVW